MIFAHRLRELRVPRGYRTARSLAQAIGIDENRYTRYERAEVEPDLGLLMKICEVLGLTPNDLLMDSVGAEQPGIHRSGSSALVDPRRPPIHASGFLAPPGFAEATPAPIFAEAAAPAEGHGHVPATAASLKRRAIAWQLARLACAHGVSLGVAGPASAGQLSTVQRTSRVFAAIERDPFAFVTAMAGNDRIIALPDADQKRIAALIDELIAAVDVAAEASARAGG